MSERHEEENRKDNLTSEEKQFLEDIKALHSEARNMEDGKTRSPEFDDRLMEAISKEPVPSSESADKVLNWMEESSHEKQTSKSDQSKPDNEIRNHSHKGVSQDNVEKENGRH